MKMQIRIGIILLISGIFSLWFYTTPTTQIDPETLTQYLQQAISAQNKGNYVEAERLHRKVVEEFRQIPDLPPSILANQLSNLASTLNFQNNPTLALNLLKEAQEILAKDPSNNLDQNVTLSLNLGDTYALLEDWDKAELSINKGLGTLESNGLSDSLFNFTGGVSLAYVYWKTGRLMQAKLLYENGISFLEKQVDQNHPLLNRWKMQYLKLIKEIDDKE